MTETNLTGAALEVAQKRETQGLNLTLGVHFTKVEPGLVEAEMPITPALLQPFGFLHGGATIALLESSLRPAASWRATWRLSSPSAWR